jgi:hypothetical protein
MKRSYATDCSRTRNLNIAEAEVSQWTRFIASLQHLPTSRPTLRTRVSLLSSHISVGLPSDLFRRDFPSKIFCLTDSFILTILRCRFQWSSGLGRGSAADRWLGLWVRIPPGAWMSVSCECCVLSGRRLGERPIPRPGDPTDSDVCN